MDLKKRTIFIFCYVYFLHVLKNVFANGQLRLLRLSVIARCGIKNVSLVESSGSNVEVQHGNHSHERHFSVELLASVFLLTEC